MANRATQIVNFYETTLASILPSGNTSTTLSNTPGINATLGNEDTWFYLVIDPDSSGNREVVVVKASSGTSLSTIERDLENDHSGTGPDHQSGTTVRLAVLAQHIDDQNDKITASLANVIQTSQIGNGLNWTGSSLVVDINGSTDGTSITVDTDADRLLVYDSDATSVKKIKPSQIATPVKLTNSRIFFASNG
jgi:hypothetical protein